MTSRCTRLCTGSLTNVLFDETRPEQVVAIDDGAARRREVVGALRTVEARQRAADGEDLGRAGLVGIDTRGSGAARCGLRRR